MSVEPSRTDRPFEVVGFAGSLRRASYNRALLQAAAELGVPRLHVVVHDLSPIPLYNADVETAGVPSAVTELRTAMRQADGLLIATPEYNHGVPGVLKNPIDWLSRPPQESALNGKVAAIMGASPGMTGTARSQTPTSTGVCVHEHVRAVTA
jgi:chromate reductase